MILAILYSNIHQITIKYKRQYSSFENLTLEELLFLPLRSKTCSLHRTFRCITGSLRLSFLCVSGFFYRDSNVADVTLALHRSITRCRGSMNTTNCLFVFPTNFHRCLQVINIYKGNRQAVSSIHIYSPASGYTSVQRQGYIGNIRVYVKPATVCAAFVQRLSFSSLLL